MLRRGFKFSSACGLGLATLAAAGTVTSRALAQACCAGGSAVTPARLELHEQALAGVELRAGGALGSYEPDGHYLRNPSGDTELDSSKISSAPSASCAEGYAFEGDATDSGGISIPESAKRLTTVSLSVLWPVNDEWRLFGGLYVEPTVSGFGTNQPADVPSVPLVGARGEHLDVRALAGHPHCGGSVAGPRCSPRAQAQEEAPVTTRTS
jgi:hypothetical protein